MFELTRENAANWLAGQGFPASGWNVTELGGGVSNTVLLAERGRQRLVLKQSLAKLRVEQEWLSERTRIHREADALRALASRLEVPEVVAEDRANCLFAMTAAPVGARTWKALLMAGEIEGDAAARIGGMLASLARAGWRDEAWRERFGDQTVFDQLRLDPYYRSTARRHPDLAGAFARLLEGAARPLSLVHGDWSPKNFLVAGNSITAIDFEVIHFGDPAFDTGFLLNHLALKCFHLPQWRGRLAEAAARFWQTYRAGLPEPASWLEAATLAHLGGLMLARIDGKSPAEYITAPEERARVRDFARDLMREPPAAVEEVFERLCR